MKPETITNLIFWILIINIPISLGLSFVIIAMEGNNYTVNFVWDFNPIYLFSVFLGFIVLYPILFISLYLMSYIIIKIIRIFVKK